MSYDIGLKVPSENLPELHFVAAIQDTLSTNRSADKTRHTEQMCE